MMESCEFKNGKALVKFNNTGGAPLQAKDSNVVKGFAFCDNDEKFIRARAQVVDEDTVEVFSEKVKNPTIVYYGWAQNPKGINLINKAGLPASPFRYGKKPEINLMKGIIPEAIAKQYELVYAFDPRSARCENGTKFIYTTDNSDKVTGPFKKIAYSLAFRNNKEEVKYVFVEMDAFTDDIKKIGVPDKASDAHFQQNVKNVKVKANANGVKNGKFADGCNIEFWDNNYAPQNEKKVPGASDSKFDFGDKVDKNVSPGYGSMQVHNFKEKQTIFSFSNFRAGPNADVGIGNANGGNTDWTFSKNARNLQVAELKVFIKK